MKRFALAVICCTLATSALAVTKSCEELKAEIEAKIQANNVSSYTLEIVTNDEVHELPEDQEADDEDDRPEDQRGVAPAV